MEVYLFPKEKTAIDACRRIQGGRGQLKRQENGNLILKSETDHYSFLWTVIRGRDGKISVILTLTDFREAEECSITYTTTLSASPEVALGKVNEAIKKNRKPIKPNR